MRVRRARVLARTKLMLRACQLGKVARGGQRENGKPSGSEERQGRQRRGRRTEKGDTVDLCEDGGDGLENKKGKEERKWKFGPRQPWTMIIEVKSSQACGILIWLFRTPLWNQSLRKMMPRPCPFGSTSSIHNSPCSPPFRPGDSYAIHQKTECRKSFVGRVVGRPHCLP